MALDHLRYLDASTLSELLTAYTDCLKAIATTGQSYSIAGRTFTRADIRAVTETIAAIKSAQRAQSGSKVTHYYTDFRT